MNIPHTINESRKQKMNKPHTINESRKQKKKIVECHYETFIQNWALFISKNMDLIVWEAYKNACWVHFSNKKK